MAAAHRCSEHRKHFFHPENTLSTILHGDYTMCQSCLGQPSTQTWALAKMPPSASSSLPFAQANNYSTEQSSMFASSHCWCVTYTLTLASVHSLLGSMTCHSAASFSSFSEPLGQGFWGSDAFPPKHMCDSTPTIYACTESSTCH